MYAGTIQHITTTGHIPAWRNEICVHAWRNEICVHRGRMVFHVMGRPAPRANRY